MKCYTVHITLIGESVKHVEVEFKQSAMGKPYPQIEFDPGWVMVTDEHGYVHSYPAWRVEYVKHVAVQENYR